jgi:hypothetical protein
VAPNTAITFWLGGPAGNGFSADPTDPFDINTFVNNLPQQASRIGPFFTFDVSRCGYKGSAPVTTVSGATAYIAKSIGGVPVTLLNLCDYFPDNNIGVSSSNSPYVYFAARNGNYTFLMSSGTASSVTQFPYGSIVVLPYLDSRQMPPYTPGGGTTYAPVWINPKTFQILCPGLDGVYGDFSGAATGTPATWVNIVAGTTLLNNAPCGFYPSGANYPPNTMDDITNFTIGATVQDDMSP